MTIAPGTGDRKGGRAGGRAPVSAADVAVAAVVLAVVAALWRETAQFPAVSPLLAQNIPPEFFPRLVLATIAVLALVLPFEPLILSRSDRPTAPRPRLPAMTWKTMALLAAAVAAIPWLGLVPTIAFASLALPLVWGERRWKLLLPFAVLFPAAIYAVFTGLLKVRFEPGLVMPLLGIN